MPWKSLREQTWTASGHRYPQCRDYPVITSSDAHYLEDIGAAVTVAMMAEPSFQELGKALGNRDGRRILELKTRGGVP